MSDRLGGFLARWDIGRNDYRVEPGLYACGEPTRTSPVLVTANYKLSFDSLRRELSEINAWILVLDTKGINVWCAAGKGTFGTEELITRIRSSGLKSIVDSHELIIPQLGATGVAGFRVTAETGFGVRFGPVYARDIPRYLASGMNKTSAMRDVTFTLGERLAVAPVEIAHSWPIALIAATAALLFAFPFGKPLGAANAFVPTFIANVAILLGGVVAGTLAFPALLPYLPFKAFSAKGAILGFMWCAAAIALSLSAIMPRDRATLGVALRLLPAALISIPATSYLSMNFTGSSTFTCQIGTEMEVRASLPLQIACAAIGAISGIAMTVARAL